MSGVGAGAVGAAEDASSEFVFLSGVGEAGRCKIYLLLSENFDPRVVNLSEESSQLNRKHEEERKRGEAGMFGVVVVVGGGTSRTPTVSKGVFF